MPISSIPVREAFIERMMKRYSESTKNIIDTLVDARNWYSNFKEDDCPINDDTLAAVSVYLRHRYVITELSIKEEIRDYNKRVKLKKKRDNLK